MAMHPMNSKHHHQNEVTNYLEEAVTIIHSEENTHHQHYAVENELLSKLSIDTLRFIH